MHASLLGGGGGFKRRSSCWQRCLSPRCLLRASLLSVWAPRWAVWRRGTGCAHVFVPLIYLCLLLISAIVLVLCLLLVLAMAIALSFAIVFAAGVPVAKSNCVRLNNRGG
jgi:hypothetical protein